MPPCMTGNQKALDLDAVNVKDLSIVKQPLFVADGHLRQRIEMIEDLAVCFSGQIAVLDFAYVQLCILKQPRYIRLIAFLWNSVAFFDMIAPHFSVVIQSQPFLFLRF